MGNSQSQHHLVRSFAGSYVPPRNPQKAQHFWHNFAHRTLGMLERRAGHECASRKAFFGALLTRLLSGMFFGLLRSYYIAMKPKRYVLVYTLSPGLTQQPSLGGMSGQPTRALSKLLFWQPEPTWAGAQIVPGSSGGIVLP